MALHSRFMPTAALLADCLQAAQCCDCDELGYNIAWFGACQLITVSCADDAAGDRPSLAKRIIGRFIGAAMGTGSISSNTSSPKCEDAKNRKGSDVHPSQPGSATEPPESTGANTLPAASLDQTCSCLSTRACSNTHVTSIRHEDAVALPASTCFRVTDFLGVLSL